MRTKGIAVIGTVEERLRLLAEGHEEDDSEQIGMRLALLSMADLLAAAAAMVESEAA